MASTTYTFTYRTAAGSTQSFRCLASTHEAAVALFAEERTIVRAVTGGAVFPMSVEVAR